ncbi:hypothetical protein ACFWAT_01110 [Streptomyces syringium]|uniref:hypothetical protein n=1 Tax=Streptomyces syringium TaxID=76729 RepID=UPI00365A06F6
MARTYGHEAESRRHVLRLLAPGLPPEDRTALRRLFGADAPEPEAEEHDGGGVAPGAALREALAAPGAPALGRLADAARKAGELDDELAVELVERARPARALAGLLGSAVAPDGRATARLGDLAARHLGTDPVRWRGVHDALGTYRGTLPELLAAEPKPATGPIPLPPRTVPATLCLLLEHAPPEHAAAALPTLPDSTLRDMLATGSLPGPALTATVADRGDRRSRTALAGHPRLDARVLKRLVAADDPAVNAAVYRNPRCTPSLRRAIAHAVHRVPLERGLRAELLSATGDVPRTWLVPLLGCGDPELVVRALGQDVRRTAQRYALVRVWEHRGPDAVRRMLADPATTRHLHPDIGTEATTALDEPDGAARLRARGEPYEDPGTLTRLLATVRGTSTIRDLIGEPYAQDFRALAAANRRTPFMPKAAEELVRHEDATDEDRIDFSLSVLNASWRAAGRYGGNLTPPARRLAQEPLDDSARQWTTGMVRAGFLDPVDVVRLARPAAHAVSALATVADRGLLTEDAREALRTAAREHLSGRPEAWEALARLVPAFDGTLPELLTAAGRTPPADGTIEKAGRGSREQSTPEQLAPEQDTACPTAVADPADRLPDAPRGERQRAALSALDLLLSLCPGDAPLPTDPGSLHFLAHTDLVDCPGWDSPDWLIRACRDHGVAPKDGWYAAPTRDEVLTELTRPHHRTAWRLAERAYAHGILHADDILHTFPACQLIHLPHDWRRLAFPVAWRNALAELLHRELGTDADAWLRLAAAASAEAHSDSWRRDDGATWPEVLDRSRTLPVPDGADVAAPREDMGEGESRHTPVPTTPDEAVRLLARGNHLWLWPAGTLLCLARPETVATVLPRLGPDGPWLLAAHLLRYDHTPQAAFDHLLRLRDPRALRVLAEQSRWLNEDLEHRLADLQDPATDLMLIRNSQNHFVRRRIATTAPSRVAGPLTRELRADPAATPPGGALWLQSAEPDLIELVFARMGRHLGLAQQIVGCLNLLEHGGRQRLASLVDSGHLGPAATRLCQKALAADDPAAVLRARADRELATDKFAGRLRRCDQRWSVMNQIHGLPGEPDWDLLEAEHRRAPLPHWSLLVNHPGAPAEFRLRHAADLPAPTRRGTTTADTETTRARIRHGLGDHFREPLTVQLDHLLGAGLLTGPELVDDAAPAALVLAYLNAARHRTDAPAPVRAALAEVATLVRGRLGTDAAAWRRVVDRLTERDPGWNPLSPVASLIGATGQ